MSIRAAGDTLRRGIWRRAAGKLRGRARDEAEWRTLLDAGACEPVEVRDGPIEARCR
jgi:hypothetical protein